MSDSELPDDELAIDMAPVLLNHGHAAPILRLASRIGWMAKWESCSKQARMESAAKLLTEAHKIMAQIEAEEADEANDLKELRTKQP